MKTYLVTTHYEMEVEANNEEEAIENYFQELNSSNRTSETEFAECTKTEEITK